MACEARSGLKRKQAADNAYASDAVGMACEARSGLKRKQAADNAYASDAVGMACEARSGLKHYKPHIHTITIQRWDGL